MKILKKFDHNTLSLLGMYVVVLVAMLILNPSGYYSALNIRSMFYLFPEYGVLTFGMMLCMISGGIDLSLVGIANLSGVVGLYYGTYGRNRGRSRRNPSGNRGCASGRRFMRML